MVWVARKVAGPDEGRLVAIKTLLEADEQTRTALHDEGALTVAIRHPNVAALLDTGEHEGVPYLVMEWVDGQSLDVILQHAAQSGGLPIELALGWVIQACRGLHAAHELRGADGELRGLIHRDISPQNVMVTYDGTVKLVDFGIAKANQRSTRTQLGEIKGKVAYMAPEQVRGAALDRRVDVFAMGIVLYLLTTGRHPYKANTPAETIRRICFSGPPLLPSKFLSDYPGALEPILTKALSAERDDRYATALELAEALEGVSPSLAGAHPREGYLITLLADRIAERRAVLDEALAVAEAKREARNAPTVPPPRSLPSRGDVDVVLPEFPRDREPWANTFSSLRALIISGASSETPGGAAAQRTPRRRALSRGTLLALASVLAAAVVLSLGLLPKLSVAAGAKTSASAPLRLVERTLAVLRANPTGVRK